MSEAAVSIVFEFARTDTPDDPYAFRFKPQDYTLRTKHGGRKSVHLAWADELLDDLGALREPNCDPAIIERVGRCLRAFLEPAGWAWHAQSIAQSAQRSEQIFLTIRSAAAELYALPWELLSLEGTGQFVGELPSLLIRYEWPETHTVPALAAASARQGRILMAWSDAGGSVPHHEHIDAIQTSCQRGGVEFVANRDVLGRVSVGALADELERSASSGRPVSVLHLLCHGGKAGRTNGVLFNSERDTRAVAVDAFRLRQLLAPYAGTLRLVVLMVCDSANGGEFDSIAQSLHRAGIQAVVGSRFLFSVRGSMRVAESFYHAMLVQRQSLEDAFRYTRKQLAREPVYLDWASLQLYARRADGTESHPLVMKQLESPLSSNQADMLTRIAFDKLDLPSLIQLRDQATDAMSSRFTSDIGLACVELVDADHAIVTEPRLLKLCRDLLATQAVPGQGRFFDLDPNRIFVTLPDVRGATQLLADFCQSVTEHNYGESRDSQLTIRVGLHRGVIYTDGNVVTGPGVDVVKAITHAARSGEILLSARALRAAPKITQALCSVVNPTDSVAEASPTQLYLYTWRDNSRLPASVLLEHADQEIQLPERDLISFGRLDTLPDGTIANDVVLSHPEDRVQRAISRWHFELRRKQSGYVLRSISRLGTQVDDKTVAVDQEEPVQIGTVICVAQRLRLILKGDDGSASRRHGATMTIGMPL